VYLGDQERFGKVTSTLVEVAAKAGQTPAEVALGWVLRQEPITSVLIGAQSVDEVRQNLAVADLEIDEALWSELDAATAPTPSYPSDFYARQSWLLGAMARPKQEVPNP
jgi:aryl-alcohol dehydrogenase-like predicted oxidoreductase